MDQVGFEPTSFSLQGSCSTELELQARADVRSTDRAKRKTEQSKPMPVSTHPLATGTGAPVRLIFLEHPAGIEPTLFTLAT